MSVTLTTEPAAPRQPVARVEEQEPWVKRWNWGLVAALAVMIAPTLFSRESFLAPNFFRTDFAKTVEAVALGFLILWVIQQRWAPRFNLSMVLCTMFVSWAILSGFWIEHWGGYISQIKKLTHSFATTLALFVAIRTRRDLETTMLVWKTVSFVFAAMMVGETFIPALRMRGAEMMGELGAHRARGPSGHANWSGFFLGTTMLMQPYFWYRYPTPRMRALIAVVFLTEMFAMVFAHVRLGLVGLLVGYGWLVLRGAFGSRLKPIVMATFGLVLMWPVLPESWKTRSFDTEFISEDYSVQSRLALQFESLRLGLDAGWLGAGYGGFGYRLMMQGEGDAAEDNIRKMNKESIGENKANWIGTLGTHNGYLEILIEAGIIGLALWVGTAFVLFVGAWTCGILNRGDPGAWQLGLMLEAMILSLGAMLVLLHAQERRVIFTMVAVGSAYMALTRSGLMRGHPGAEPRLGRDALRFLIPFSIGLAFLFGSASLVALFLR